MKEVIFWFHRWKIILSILYSFIPMCILGYILLNIKLPPLVVSIIFVIFLLCGHIFTKLVILFIRLPLVIFINEKWIIDRSGFFWEKFITWEIVEEIKIDSHKYPWCIAIFTKLNISPFYESMTAFHEFLINVASLKYGTSTFITTWLIDYPMQWIYNALIEFFEDYKIRHQKIVNVHKNQLAAWKLKKPTIKKPKKEKIGETADDKWTPIF